MLLDSALQNTYPSEETFGEMVNELVAKMTDNKEYIDYFLLPRNYTWDEFTLRKKARVFIWDVPTNEEFYKRSKINSFAALPIFDSRQVQNEIPLSEVRENLKLNLKISVQRLFLDLSGRKDIKTIGFAALSGSEQ